MIPHLLISFLLFLSPEKTSPYSSSKTVATPQNKDTVWGVVMSGRCVAP